MMQPVTYPENKDSGRGNIVIYQAGNTSPELEVRLEDESLWLSLKQLSDLFGRDKSFLSRHLRNIYESCELDRKTTVAFFATVQKEGERQIERQIKNHSFVDGNKRIAAALFLWFMEKNGLLYTHSGAKKIADTTLVAMTLMIAESNPKEMLMIVTMTINLIIQ